ncbi:hypothetical protein ER308_20700 [Egibacter rhizosphaerae]|uniref:Uncharacterized protein n=1 Tax=Egibacter rhizosphaerae TaxID=1670831 RepID=A0A411YKM0_9ACTN|nr:hypothetical protein [Egibacter rhizosphaerae]QBI21737.1 hypothetical protein ER308_20700 [Egibacter rhizosphaerae]
MVTARIVAAFVALLLVAAACSPETEPDPEIEDEDGAIDGEAEGPPGDDPGPEEDDEDPDDDDPSDDPEDEEAQLDELIERLTSEVGELRELEWEDEVETEVVSGDELAEIATDRDLDAGDRDELADWSRVLASLRHIPEGGDLEEIYDELQASGVAGLYDPEDEVAYVGSEELPPGPSATVTTAHELVHALQDQHFDLERLDDLEDDDAVLAFLSVVEGDAVLIEEEWQARHLSEEEQGEAQREELEAVGEVQEVLAELPEYVVESFLFPYTAGERFVAALREQGGFAAVNEALEDPPTTTLEILDPDRYLEGFEPEEVDPGQAPGDDWEPLVDGSFGAFELLVLFGEVEDTQAPAAWPWWRGGAIEAWEQDGELVVAAGWWLDDAEEAPLVVCDAVPSWYAQVANADEPSEREVASGELTLEGDRDAFALACEDQLVRFALAPDAETAERALGR